MDLKLMFNFSLDNTSLLLKEKIKKLTCSLPMCFCLVVLIRSETQEM